MPSLIHASSRLTGSPGVALISQSVSEQVNGLVTVSCDFVCTAAQSLQIDKLFYPDAPPPIFPSSVNRDYLLARQLFMVERSLSQENGLTYVSATYAGGLVRGGSYIFKTQERESPVSFSFVSEPFSIQFQNPDNPDNTSTAGNLTSSFAYSFMPIVHIYEYVQVGAETTGIPTPPAPQALYILLSFSSSIPVRAPELGWSGLKYISYPREWFTNQIEGRVMLEDIKTNDLTPSVKEVTRRYYIE
jgi:hypothetical protein